MLEKDCFASGKRLKENLLQGIFRYSVDTLNNNKCKIFFAFTYFSLT